MSSEQRGELVRAIGRWSLAALMVNSVIGSGIFGLPSIVAGLVGKASVVAYVIAAAGIGVIMACFAEVASQFRDAGGPYLYAREALGRFLGIQTGWLAWLVRVTSLAANANLFVIYLAEFWPRAKEPLPRAVALTLLLGVLAAINYRGVKAGAQVSNFFVIAKLVPLAVFIAAGMFYLLHHTAVVNPPAPTPSTRAWFEALLVLVFAYGGFESGGMPMSEAKTPRRDAPFALFLALAITTTVYVLIQLVVIGVLPLSSATDRPLAAAARVFLGAGGAAMISAGALISVYGLLSANMLNAPRLTFALAERGDFPPLFAAVHHRFRTPHVSIVVFAVLVWALSIAGTFRWNVVLSAVARLFTYGVVCLALLALRRKRPGADAYRLPAGAVLAWLGLAFCVVMVTRMGRGELIALGVTLIIAALNWVWARRVSNSE